MSDLIRKKPVPRPPAKPRTCREFLDHWMPILRQKLDGAVELDFSFIQDGITATDMRIPAALRTELIYKRHEVEEGADLAPGDFDRRIAAFLAKAK